MSERTDVSVVLPGVPWQELARRYEVALRVADELIEELLGYALPSWDWKYGDYWREEQAKVRAALAAPAPSATTAETASDACTCSKDGCAVHDNGPCSECGKSFHDCQCTAEQKTQAWQKWFQENGYAQPAPPSSAGEATGVAAFPVTGSLTGILKQELQIVRQQLATARAEVERQRIEIMNQRAEILSINERADMTESRLQEEKAWASSWKSRAMAEMQERDVDAEDRRKYLADLATARAALSTIAVIIGLQPDASHASITEGVRQVDHNLRLRCEREDEFRKQRDEAEAAAGAYREVLQQAVDERSICCDANTDDDGNSVCIGEDCIAEKCKRALAPDIGKAWLRERDELRERCGELTTLLTEAMHCILYVDAHFMTERVPVAEKIAKAIGHQWPPYDVCSDCGCAKGEDCDGCDADCHALTPPAPSDSDGEKGGK